jgi:hypothetical protein
VGMEGPAEGEVVDEMTGIKWEGRRV